jgi:D-arabinan endo alpha-(1,5)-arabinofuranosidase
MEFRNAALDVPYLNENTACLELREADHLWGPWTAPHVLATARDYPQLYGAFMTPSFLRDNGRTLLFVMSQFGPYNTFLMKVRLTYTP